MSFVRIRARLWSLLGLPAVSPLVSCLPPTAAEQAPRPTAVVDVPMPSESEAPAASAAIDASPPAKGIVRACPKDHFRAWACGPALDGATLAKDAYTECADTFSGCLISVVMPADGQIDAQIGPKTPIDPLLSDAWRKEAEPDSCCYSRCVRAGVRATADERPSGWYHHAVCITAMSGTSVPAPGRPDCPAALEVPTGPDGKFAAAFDPEQTATYEDSWDRDVCCYRSIFEAQIMRGRALRRDGEAYVATTEPRRDWLTAAGDVALPSEHRDELTRHWLEAAAYEHASIASFARLSLQLLALGAPPDLVLDTHRAAADEVEHARTSYALATRYGGTPVGPGTLPAPPTGDVTLAELARESFIDGCIGELLAATVASEGAKLARDPVLAGILDTIAADELRHAELAWRIVAWSVRQSPSAAAALRHELDALATSAPGTPPAPGPLAPHGLLADAHIAHLRATLLQEVVAPCARALLDPAPTISPPSPA